MAIRQAVDTAREGFVRNPDARYEPVESEYVREVLGEGAEVEVTYEGRVVATGENNGYDDSDFYAIVEVEPGKFQKVVYGSTRYWYAGSAEVDATYEVRVRGFQRYQEVKAQMIKDAAEREERTARAGKETVITGGRKHKGRAGVVTWVGESYGEARMRVQPEDGSDSFYVPVGYGGFDYPKVESRYGYGREDGAIYAIMAEGLPTSMPVKDEEVVPS